jgi:fructosamine-3-kinase
MISKELINVIEERLPRPQGVKIRINRVLETGGGDINRTFRIMCDDSSYFLKMNDADSFPDMFQKEADGLTLMAGATSLQVPLPLFAGISGSDSFLVMEWLEKAKPLSGFWMNFALGLVELHRHTRDSFGLAEDNYIGSLKQSNLSCDSWEEFYRSRRLEPLLKIAFEGAMLDPKLLKASQRLGSVLGDLFPRESPSLLHGDLWAGNFLSTFPGRPSLFDPSVYYGHREMDLGMSMLFGGFDTSFYEAYQYHWPLEPGWRERILVCQLYPLLVHLILFGGSYSQQVSEILERY